MRSVIIYTIAIVNLISLLHLGLYISGANIYDIKQLKRARQRAKKTEKRKTPLRQPLVSVIVPAYNEEIGIVRTLDSIRQSTYANYEIIVVNDGSKDNTEYIANKYVRHLPRVEAKTYMARNPRSGKLERRILSEQPIHHPRIEVVTQDNQGKGAALNNGIANYAKGQFVMCLDADSLIREDAISNTVEHFRDPTVLGVAANVRVMGGNNWLSLLQRFEHMMGYRSKKFYSLTSTEFIIGGVASTYRRSTLKKVGLYDTDTMTEDIGLSMKIIAKQGNRKKSIRYAADVVAMTGGVLTYRQLIRQRYRWKMGMLQNLFKYRSLILNTNSDKYRLGLTLYRLPMSVISEITLLLTPFILAYIALISIQRHSLGIILGAYITITLYTLWNIWPDEYLTLRQKIRMSVFSLYMYGIFYAMDLVQIIAMVQCIKNYRTIIDGNQHGGAWVPPTRAVQQAAV